MTNVRVILHGKAAGDPRVRTAVESLRRERWRIEARVTWEPGDAARLTAEALAETAANKVDCLVAGGGDGTINEVFAAAYQTGLPRDCTLGVLPLGTANDFAHSAGLPVHDIDAALRLAVSAPPRWIDLGALDGRPFVNLVSGGFGCRVTAETDPELKRRLGGMAYLITGASRFAELSACQGRFRAEGFAWEGRFLALAIGNGRSAGGGVPLCPQALIDDGLLDLTIVPELDRAARFDALSRLLRDGAAAVPTLVVAARSPWIEFESSDDLNINLDGEPIVAKRFRVECRPRAAPVRLGDGGPLFGPAPAAEAARAESPSRPR